MIKEVIYNHLLLIILSGFLMMSAFWLTLYFLKRYCWILLTNFLIVFLGLFYYFFEKLQNFLTQVDLGIGFKIIITACCLYSGFMIVDWLQFKFSGYEKIIKWLEIMANDSDNWSEAWRQEQVEKRYRDIIDTSTKIQDAYWKNRDKRFYLPPYIAWFFWGLNPKAVRSWLIAHRDEQHKRLQMARQIMSRKEATNETL